MPEHIKAAHKVTMSNRAAIEVSDICGCCDCQAIFPPADITRWIKDRNGDTPECPKCGIDCVLGSSQGYPITPEFLAELSFYWFGEDEDNQDDLAT
jgi:NAD-dependent SIR2 family protein deacetylase